MTDARVAVVIEDDVDARELTQLVLTQSGFTVIAAADGPAGIEAVRQHNPILTTLDVQMPGMDGFAVAKRLREFSLTYLVMITSMASEIDIIQGFEAGADDYLVKPFRPRELRARADSMLRRPRERAGVPNAPAAPAEMSWAAQLARELGESPLAPLPGMASAPAPAAAPAPAPAPVATPAPAPAPRRPPSTPRRPPLLPPRRPRLPRAHSGSGPRSGPRRAPARHRLLSPRPAPAPVLPEPSVGTAPNAPVAGGVLVVGPLRLDATSGHTTLNGRTLDLSTAERELLSTLMRTGRRVRSKADLVLALRGHSHVSSHFVNEADKRTVDAHVVTLKAKLGDESDPAKLIDTVRGVGYRMAVD